MDDALTESPAQIVRRSLLASDHDEGTAPTTSTGDGRHPSSRLFAGKALPNGKERRAKHRRRVLLLRVATLVLVFGLCELGTQLGSIDFFFFGQLLRSGSIWLPTCPPLCSGWIWRPRSARCFSRSRWVWRSVAGSRSCLPDISSFTTLSTPIIYALYSLPRIALMPLFALWFGIGTASKVALGFSIVVFIMLLNTYSGIRNVDRYLIDAVRMMGASRRFVYRFVVLPGIVSWLVAGFRLSTSYALLAAVVGEMISAQVGLGKRLVTYQAMFDRSGIFELLAVLAVLAIIVNQLTQIVERRLGRWRGQRQLGAVT